MAGFVGLTVSLTLKQGSVIQGYVQAVDASSASLVLQDAFLPLSGQRLGAFTVQGPSIADLQIVEQQQHIPPLPPPHSVLTHAPPPPQEPEPFEDPAILSFGKRPTALTATDPTAQVASSNVRIPSPRGLPPLADKQSTTQNLAGGNRTGQPRKSAEPVAAIQKPFSNLQINGVAQREQIYDTDDQPTGPTVRRVSLNKTRNGKLMDESVPSTTTNNSKKGRKKKREEGAAATVEHEPEVESTPTATRLPPNQFRGKGWRQTPILQEPMASSPKQSAGQGSARRSKKQRAMEKEVMNNGWATGDATDIQELPEFDFASNLSKFDKRTVFDQIRTEDTTADEERLVHFNRTPARPGTYGGKNLHPTENVLDSPKIAQRGSSQETSSDDGFNADTRSTRRVGSRASSRRAGLRNANLADETGSIKEFARSRGIARPPYAGSSSHGIGGSPKPGRYTPPESPAESQKLGAHLRVVSTNRVCPVIMPAGMAAIEEVAETEFGFTSEIMTENAGRGIADVAMATVNFDRRSTRDRRVDPRPWALIIAGNHKSGARALAACRQLRGRNIRTLACVLGYDRQTVELDKEVKKQADILVKMSGYVRGWTETKNCLVNEGQPPDLIIDALLAASKPFDVLNSEDQRSVLEIVSWSSKNNDNVAPNATAPTTTTLSIDLPSGINGSTGEPSLLNPTTGAVLTMPSQHIICTGAPRVGLLRAFQRLAVQNASKSSSSGAVVFGPELLSAQIWVVDLGVEKAWKRSGLAGSKGVGFGREWVVPVRLAEGVAE